ncbi:MAG: electron transport complex subunit RsxA, partial [Lachnospiraceae bacterium]|nr:electron transport complex subunit RsxA [Lachnospiraceae bacterium]
LPLITTNCAVLGVALNNVTNGLSVAESIITGIGTAVGYLVAIVILAGIRERIDNSDVPQSFKGMPIVCIVAGIMAIAYMGFSNLAI